MPHGFKPDSSHHSANWKRYCFKSFDVPNQLRQRTRLVVRQISCSVPLRNTTTGCLTVPTQTLLSPATVGAWPYGFKYIAECSDDALFLRLKCSTVLRVLQPTTPARTIINQLFRRRCGIRKQTSARCAVATLAFQMRPEIYHLAEPLRHRHAARRRDHRLSLIRSPPPEPPSESLRCLHRPIRPAIAKPILFEIT
jgi:hypothetical protein